MINKEKMLFWIGVYLVLDGIISYIHFKNTATQVEQLFRIVRAGIGVALILW